MPVDSEYFEIDEAAFPVTSASYFGIWTFAYSNIQPLGGAGPDALGYAVAGAKKLGMAVAGRKEAGIALAGAKQMGFKK